jgi:peptidoglycan/LPS O-acetylase OafA/YrhL
VKAGWIGVDLFFVLSGFLITGILCDTKDSGSYFRTFYIRRCLRIFPLYYATLFVFLVVLPWIFASDGRLQYLTEHAVWYWTYLSNVLVARIGWHPLGMLDHFWSLAVEEQFYLVWPIVVALTSRDRLRQICVALIVGSLVARIGLRLGGYEVASYVLGPTRMDALAVGGILAVTARGSDGLSRIASASRRMFVVTLFMIGVLWVWRGGLEQNDIVVGTIGHTLLVCLLGSLLVIAMTTAPSTLISRFMSAPSMRFFGRYSYALYVFHPPLMFIRPSWLAPAAVPTILGSQLPALFLYIAAAVIVSVVLSLASWHVCEKQFLKLKKFFPYDSGRTGAISVSPPGTPVAAFAGHASSTPGARLIEGGR